MEKWPASGSFSGCVGAAALGSLIIFEAQRCLKVRTLEQAKGNDEKCFFFRLFHVLVIFLKYYIKL